MQRSTPPTIISHMKKPLAYSLYRCIHSSQFVVYDITPGPSTPIALWLRDGDYVYISDVVTKCLEGEYLFHEGLVPQTGACFQVMLIAKNYFEKVS